MTDTSQLADLFKQQFERDKEVVSSIEEQIKTIFTNPEQAQVVTEMYQHMYKLSSDFQELNLANMFANAYIEAFYEILVGEGKLIDETLYREHSNNAYSRSLETVKAARKQMEEEIQSNE